MMAVRRAISSRCWGVVTRSDSPLPPSRTASGRLRTTIDRREASWSGSGTRSTLSARVRSSMCSRSHGTAVNCTRWVSSCRHTHWRKSAGSRSSSRSTSTTLGATSSSWGVPPGARSYCPRTLLARKAISAPVSPPVTLPPTAAAAGPTGLVREARSLSWTGAIIPRIERTLASIHPPRSTTRAGSALAGACMRAVSATCWAERTAASRRARTASAASAGVTWGPRGTRRRPVAAAKSQSTSSVVSGRWSCLVSWLMTWSTSRGRDPFPSEDEPVCRTARLGARRPGSAPAVPARRPRLVRRPPPRVASPVSRRRARLVWRPPSHVAAPVSCCNPRRARRAETEDGSADGERAVTGTHSSPGVRPAHRAPRAPPRCRTRRGCRRPARRRRAAGRPRPRPCRRAS